MSDESPSAIDHSDLDAVLKRLDKLERDAAKAKDTSDRWSVNRNFSLAHGDGCSGWGSWETKARWTNFNLRDLVAGDYNDLTVGMDSA